MSFSPSLSSSSDASLSAEQLYGWLLDVPCSVEFVLGTARVKVRDCIDFEKGSVVRLDQAAGADIELRAAGVPIVTGEIVVLDDNIGLRVNRILPPNENEIG
jgi:flagellar motor switch protein FliN/FliY